MTSAWLLGLGVAGLLTAHTAHAIPVTSLNRVEATRAQALGGATSALGGDAALVWLNPAASGKMTSSSLTLAGQRGYFGDLIGQGLGVIPLGIGVMSVGFSTYNSGVVTLNALDGTTRQVIGHQDIMGMVGLSRALSAGVDAGVSVKGVRTKLFEEVGTTAVALDGGIQIRLAPMLKAGVVLQNLGTKLQYEADQISLPAAIRSGLALGWRFKGIADGSSARDALIVMADAEYPLEEKHPVWRGGVEYQWRGVLALRAGGRLSSREELSNYAAGLGLMVRQFRLDYSFQLGDTPADSPQAFSLTIGF